MNKLLASSLFALTLGAPLMSLAAPSAPAAPSPAPGWTGLSKPLEVIRARGELMSHMELLMQPIDTITIQTTPVRNVEQLHQNAEMVSAMLTALPHLFPPTTNLYDPKSTTPPTIALPAIWTSFDSFYAMAQAAAHAAKEFTTVQGDKPLRTASLRLRASCDACHALYLRKYVPPKASEADSQFDFDSALGNKKK
ncbi:MAG TPA: cytochrome c [Steroidobacteraceae bacterium]|nr:cytochrome c [Steroidobacteraceae bacterium]